jgi:hypothetical protein
MQLPSPKLKKKNTKTCQMLSANDIQMMMISQMAETEELEGVI